MEEELYPIEVVLTRMGGEAIMLVKTAPTNDYDSGQRANAWVTLAKTGRCRVVLMSPVNDDGTPKSDATAEHQRRCPEKDCVMDPGHELAHQDKTGELWDESDVMGNRVIKPLAKQSALEGAE